MRALCAAVLTQHSAIEIEYRNAYGIIGVDAVSADAPRNDGKIVIARRAGH